LRRRFFYKLALERSVATGKPLIVIGDPDAGTINQTMGRDYGCGDLCVDINGCPNCSRQVKMPIEKWLPMQPNNSAVIFTSCVLEYVDDARPLTRELLRVAGDNLFVVTVDSWTYPAYFYRQSQSKRQFLSAPPVGPFRWQEF
jgi:hypothetical protein